MSTIIRHRIDAQIGDLSIITVVVTDSTYRGFRALYQRYKIYPNGCTSMLHSEEWSAEKGAIEVFDNPQWEFPNHPNNKVALLNGDE
jgi:hypothetical protein